MSSRPVSGKTLRQTRRRIRTFRDRVLGAVRKGLLDDRGSGFALLAGFGVIALVVAGFFILPRILGNRPGGGEMAVIILIGMIIGAIVLIVFLSFRRVRVRRTTAGALEAVRWDAFRRYLTDFSRLQDAPVISLDLWDRYLVYAITFGVAEEVLEQARLHAPPELEQTSSLYWFGKLRLLGWSHRERLCRAQLCSVRGLHTAFLQWGRRWLLGWWWRWRRWRRGRRLVGASAFYRFGG